MNKDSKIYLAGHRGLLGSAILEKLTKEGYTNLIFKTSKELDLTNQKAVNNFFWDEAPEYVFLIAAKVGGVAALDKYRADSILGNLQIQNNVISNCHKYGVKKLLFTGSNCSYPVLVDKPIKEEYLMAGKLEYNTESHAVAKIAGIKMCEAYRKQYNCNFITLMLVSLYGDNDNYSDIEKCHVMAALLIKFHNAKKNNLPSVEVWGSGFARREFMHVDDVADACLFCMLNYNELEPINIGIGEDIAIKDLALMIKDITGYEGEIIFNKSKPDGVLSKVLDVTKIHNLGWHHKIELRQGIEKVYKTRFL